MVKENIYFVYIFSPVYCVYVYKITCYFPYNWKNGTWFSLSIGQDDEFENNFLIICGYLNILHFQLFRPAHGEVY